MDDAIDGNAVEDANNNNNNNNMHRVTSILTPKELMKIGLKLLLDSSARLIVRFDTLRYAPLQHHKWTKLMWNTKYIKRKGRGPYI
jgi:hypothetical protein